MATDTQSQHGRIPQQAALNMCNTVAVKVGNKGKMYTVHSAILGKSSKFFNNAMKPEWSKSKDSSLGIDLTDEDIASFEVYLNWLYFKTLPTIVKTPEKTNTDNEFYTLSKCYVLGEKLMDIAFKNALLDAFADAKAEPPLRITPGPGKGPVTILYEKTPENSLARSLLVEMWARYATADWAHLLDEMPSAFKAKLFQMLVTRRRVSQDRIDARQYHES